MTWLTNGQTDSKINDVIYKWTDRLLHVQQHTQNQKQCWPKGQNNFIFTQKNEIKPCANNKLFIKRSFVHYSKILQSLLIMHSACRPHALYFWIKIYECRINENDMTILYDLISLMLVNFKPLTRSLCLFFFVWKNCSKTTTNKNYICIYEIYWYNTCVSSLENDTYTPPLPHIPVYTYARLIVWLIWIKFHI